MEILGLRARVLCPSQAPQAGRGLAGPEGAMLWLKGSQRGFQAQSCRAGNAGGWEREALPLNPVKSEHGVSDFIQTRTSGLRLPGEQAL